MARDQKLDAARPSCHEEWARLAQQLEIKVIHIAERETQVSKRRKEHDEFVNTWSVDGFVSEGLQPVELGWGSHGKHWSPDVARHGCGSDAAIYLQRPGIATRVRSWTPLEGPYHGFLVTHAESISIADHLTLRDNHEVVYRGMGELGVLLMGNPKGVYWPGSRLGIEQARQLAPHNSATSLQVVAGILGGMVWALRNPDCGVLSRRRGRPGAAATCIRSDTRWGWRAPRRLPGCACSRIRRCSCWNAATRRACIPPRARWRHASWCWAPTSTCPNTVTWCRT